jgi:hypothetical protein
MSTIAIDHAVVETYRRLLTEAHEAWLLPTLEGLAAEQLHWQPGGRARPIAAQIAHLVMAEDTIFATAFGRYAPLMTSTHADKTGVSEPPPTGDWGEWAQRVQVDLPVALEYARAVFAFTDEYLASLSDDDLAREVDLTIIGSGVYTLAALINSMALHVAAHTGEIAAIRGMLGLQGYAF